MNKEESGKGINVFEDEGELILDSDEEALIDIIA